MIKNLILKNKLKYDNYSILYLFFINFCSPIILYYILENILENKFIEFLVKIALIFFLYRIIFKLSLDKKCSFTFFKVGVFLKLFLIYYFFNIFFDKILIYNGFIDKPIINNFDFIFFSTTVILAPIAEELFYRGFFINYLYDYLKINKFFSIIIVSFVFALMHFDFSINFINHYIFSCVVCLIYLKNKNILSVIFFHICSNMLNLLNINFFIINYKFNINLVYSTFCLLMILLLTRLYFINIKK